MPVPLANRLREDTIGEWELAAHDRLLVAMAMLSSGSRLVPVYLLGYSVEMRIKAACFRARGFGDDTPITTTDRDRAVSEWQVLGLLRKPGQHDLPGWAELLVAKRIAMGSPYPITLGNDIVDQASLLYSRWREVLRYKANQPYRHELRLGVRVALWFEMVYPDL